MDIRLSGFGALTAGVNGPSALNPGTTVMYLKRSSFYFSLRTRGFTAKKKFIMISERKC